MNNIGETIYGAKAQSYRRANPRDLFKTIMEENPGADRQTLFTEFSRQLETSPNREDYIETIIEYWCFNTFYSLSEKPHKKQSSPKPKAKPDRGRVEEMKKKIKARATEMVLMDFTLPNGKLLRDATGKDCAKAGGWLSRIAEAIKPNDIVSNVLTEKDVKRLYRV